MLHKNLLKSSSKYLTSVKMRLLNERSSRSLKASPRSLKSWFQPGRAGLSFNDASTPMPKVMEKIQMRKTVMSTPLKIIPE